MESLKPLALVTGASSGIGFELARQFAEHGFDVIVAAEDEDIATAAQFVPHTDEQLHKPQSDLQAAETT